MDETFELQAVNERKAVRLLILFLVGWIAAIMGVLVVQVHQNGYGSGFGDGNHVPDSVVRMLNVPGGEHLTEDQLEKATDK